MFKQTRPHTVVFIYYCSIVEIMVLDMLIDDPRYRPALDSVENATYISSSAESYMRLATEKFRENNPAMYKVGSGMGVAYRTFRTREINYRYKDVQLRASPTNVFMEFKWELN